MMRNNPPRRLHVARPPVAVALGLAAVACAESGSTDPSPPRPVAWTRARPAAAGAQRSLAARIRAAERVPLAFEVSGRIAAVHVDIGERFSRGDTLARIDGRSYRLRLRQRRAELNEARAAAREAEANLRRVRAMRPSGASTEAELDRAEATAQRARSRVDLLEATVGLAEDALEDTALAAPYDGEVARRRAEPSQMVSAGEPVLEIQRTEGGLEIRVSIPETLVSDLELGSVHEVRVPARDGLEFEATLTHVAADAAGPHLFPATLRPETPPGQLRSGMTAEVRLRLPPDGAAGPPSDPARVRVPISAVLARADDGAAVFVLREDDTVEARTVTVHDLTGTDAVLSGDIAPGAVVATKGVSFLRDGQRVTRLGEGVSRFNP